LGGELRVINQVWYVVGNHRHKGTIAWVPRGIVGSDQGLMHDDAALCGGRIDKDQVTHGVRRAIAVVGDADLPWPVASVLDGVGGVDVVIHQAPPRASMSVLGTKPILLLVEAAPA